VEAEAARITTEAEATRIAVEAESARRSTEESAPARRPVEESPECKQAERERYEFWVRVFMEYSITYLQGKMANESPPLQALPAQVAGDA
jgi:hypothetical protein